MTFQTNIKKFVVDTKNYVVEHQIPLLYIAATATTIVAVKNILNEDETLTLTKATAKQLDCQDGFNLYRTKYGNYALVHEAMIEPFTMD